MASSSSSSPSTSKLVLTAAVAVGATLLTVGAISRFRCRARCTSASEGKEVKQASKPTTPRPPKRILLFDVDGTLSVARKQATPEMFALLAELRQKSIVGLVGGSDLSKQKEQLGDDVLSQFDYVFSENGLTPYKDGVTLGNANLLRELGEEKLQNLLKFTLKYIANLSIPVQRGTFIEYRNGMLNISPIGRNCSQSERDTFEKYDEEEKIRATMIQALKAEFPDYPLTYSIGGQISFDVFPTGWDKTYCLRFLTEFDEIHFFGDKTAPGGNDHELFSHKRVIGHTVRDPTDTMRQVREIMASWK